MQPSTLIQEKYQELVDQYGLNDDNNLVGIWQYDAEKGKNALVPLPIFKTCDKGISIMPYDLDRFLFLSERKRESRHGSDVYREKYRIIRLYPEGAKGRKYHIPKGAGTPPFFPVQLLKLYEDKTPIDTLYVTEGYKKAFKSMNMGLPCVGLVSITCMIDRQTNKIHGDIIKLIKACQIKRIVWLTDADFRQISSKEIEDGADLTRRPSMFFNTIVRFQELLSGVEDIAVYFAHINEDLDDHPKGLDDLFIQYPDYSDDIIKEANQFDKINQGRHIGNYFTKFNITRSPYKVRQYFFFHDVTLFYLHHLERRPELKGKQFRFFGTTYRYDEKNGKCEIEVPKEAGDYFRVGDDYYEYIQIPNRYEELTKTFHNRLKSTITDDHGRDFLKFVSKYKSFCNVPNHLNYQRVINNCFNTYAPFTWEPEEGDYSQTLDFFKHIFGTNEVEINGQPTPYYELGLDYIQLLLTKPQQMLPILCLVSKERQTGKTTFAKWLKLLFTENMAIVGNQDFENSFNAHWITKLLVCVDETKIDKDFVVEKIKSLSTSSNTMLNAKGKNQVEVETFLKFILLSNNEDNFINIDRQEIRFWVLKVPTIQQRILDLEKVLIDEIPAFIDFLNNRKMVTEYKERHWFNTELLQTDILQRIKENSMPNPWKRILAAIKERFLDFPEYDVLHFALKDFNEHLLDHRSKIESSYLSYLLADNKIEHINKPMRYRIPQFRSDDAVSVNTVQKIGRPYIFHRSDIIKPEEDSELDEQEEKMPF